MQNPTASINRVTPNFSTVTRILAYSSLYLSFAGGAMVFLSCSLQDIAFSPAAALIMILVTYGVYNLNRKTDEEEDSVNHFERYSFTKKYGTFLCLSAALAYLTAFIVGLSFGPETALITLVPLLAGVVYSIPILPRMTGFSRIKEIPVMKSMVVALAWAIPPAFLPIYLISAEVSPRTWIVGLLFFILVFVNTVIFDIRDIRGDAAAGVKTIPVILGADKTVILLSVLNIGVGLFIISLGSGIFAPLQTAFLSFSILYAQIYILFFKNRSGYGTLAEIFIDGQFIILLGVFLLFSII